MVIICSSEKLVTAYWIIRCHDPEDYSPQLFSFLEEKAPGLLLKVMEEKKNMYYSKTTLSLPEKKMEVLLKQIEVKVHH
jgi:hypothetical protein